VIGKTIEHFRIIEKLGRAGMGVLYRAEDTQLRSPVVLKFLPPELTWDDRARKRLLHEAQALAALDHRNICSIRSIHENSEGVFFCMPYYEGRTLGARIADGPMPVKEALRTAIAIADGLDKAHSNDIVHRDIKPENIMITTGGNVKILDFGIAKLKDRTRVTTEGMTPGTICYMSPDQLRSNDVDGRSDIFSLGAVLYEMLTGHVPFEADGQEAVRFLIMSDDPGPLADYRNDIPKGLQAIIDKALQKDPADRYQKAAQMKADLERILRGRQPRPAVKKTLIIAASLLVTGATVWTIDRMVRPVVPADKRILVMPFASAGLDPLDQSVYDGLQAALTADLMQLEQFDHSFWVVPTDDIRKRELDDPSDAGGIFGVNLLVSGEVHSASDDHIFELTLRDAGTQRVLRTAEVTGGGEDLTGLEHKLLANVAALMDLGLPEERIREVARAGTENEAAYEAYLRGCSYLLDDASIMPAIEQFQLAVETDSMFARAHACLAGACWRVFEAHGDPVWAQNAKAGSRRALEIDPGLAPALVVLGNVYNNEDRYEDAIDLFRSALGQNPVCCDAYNGLASAYKGMGDLDKAEASYHRAIDLRPDYWPIREDLGYFYYPLGRYYDAAAQFEILIEKTPGYHMSYNNLGAFYYLLGRVDDAQAQWEKSFSIRKSGPACGNLGLIYFRKGRYAEAASMYEWAKEFESPYRGYTTWGNLAQAYARLDSVEKAAVNFQIAIDKAEAVRAMDPGDPIVPAFLAGYYADVKDYHKARTRIEQALSLAPKNPEVLFRCGHAFEKMHEREKALRWIGKAIEYDYSVDEILSDPELEALRQDPRFELLLPD
jgi:tetratricopeptide (TPR) repeat protein